MTPSEIAEALEARHKYDKINYPPASPLDRQAAATIRELEAKNKEWVETVVKLTCNDAKSEAKLKIATEALEVLWDQYKALANSGDAGFWRAEDTAEGKQAIQALARIKEV